MSNTDTINIKEGENSLFSPSSYDTDITPDGVEKMWKKIYSSLQSILSSEFSDSNKREIKSHTDRLQFACVYCGDSMRDARKKRGNLFTATLQYHCFNGDCQAHMSIYDFLKNKKQLENFTVAEIAHLESAAARNLFDLKKLKSDFGLESFLSDEISMLSIDRDFLISKLKLQEIRGSRIERYLRDRLQTSYEKFAWDNKNGILYVFNLTRDLKRVIGLQIKTFNKRNPYLTWKTSRMHIELDIYRPENEIGLSKLDHLSNIFGIFNVDLNKPITVFEGPLDSFLFPNAVAVCSAKNTVPFDIENMRFFYDNDSTGREYSIKRLLEGKAVFLWKKYIQENELVLFDHKIKDLNDLLIIAKSSKKKCKPFINYFSDSKYDIMYI